MFLISKEQRNRSFFVSIINLVYRLSRLDFSLLSFVCIENHISMEYNIPVINCLILRQFTSLLIHMNSVRGDKMHRKNKLFSTFTLLLLVALALTTTVCANAPEPPDYLTVILSERHEEAVYADLLIKIDPSDSNYTDFSPGIYADHVYSSSEIVAYDDDGYRSFTFHYKNARSDIEINRYYDKMYYVDFCRGYDYNEFFTQYEALLNEYRDVKVALLDDEFNILVVSDAIRLPKVGKLLEFNGQVTYDIRENSLDFDLWINPYFLIFGGIISALMILISIGKRRYSKLTCSLRSL